MIKVVIFDLDGLLIDSQPLQHKAYNQVFSKYGFPLTIKNWREWIQNSYNAKIWIQKNRLPLDADKIRAEKKKIYERLMRDGLKLKPGALNLINKLHGRFKLYIASSSRIESIRSALDKFKLISKFEKLVSDQELDKGKPHPDIFLKTAGLAHVHPRECLVIEDSMAGLKAAKTAKMKCIICPDTFCGIDPQEFQNADKIVHNLSEITIDAINNLN